MRAPTVLLGAVIAAFALAHISGHQLPAAPAAQDQQPTPVFRSAIDLVPVDVNVVDRDGKPVADLAAADFALTVDGKPRRVASAEFIAVSRDSETQPAPPAHYSSNTAALGGRLIMIVVDQGNIGTDRGKYAADAASRFVKKLRPSDRVGLQTIPGAGPQVDFTANHAVVETMLQKVVGQAPADHRVHQIGLSEALILDRGDERLSAEILDRECEAFFTREAGSDPSNCPQQVKLEARAMFGEVKSRTRDSLISLRHLMERLADDPTPKTVVFISEGVLLDRETADVSWLGPLAARGQVTLYVFQLEPPQPDTTRAKQSPSRYADIELAQEGLGRLAGLARGSVFRVNSNADVMFNRVAVELSGYYLLSFTPEVGDRDGKSHQIRIAVPSRRNVEVRSRREFAVAPARKKSDDEVLADTLRAPLLATDIGLKVTTYTLRDPQASKLKVILATEIDRSLTSSGTVALAYTVVSARGTLVSSQVEPVVSGALKANRTQTYFSAVAADAGVYTLKIAVVDSAGKRGSVEHTFRAQLAASGPIRMTDMLIAEAGAGAVTALTPAVSADFTGDLLQTYIELYADTPESLANVTAVVDVAENAEGRALDTTPARIQPASDPLQRVAEASVPIAFLPPGQYVARAVVTAGGRNVGQVTRPFRIVRAAPSVTAPGASATPAPGTAPPIPFTSKIDAFERASVLAPPVVGFFLDRMNVGNRIGNAPPAAVAAARAGRFDEALASLSGTAPLASVFISGLGLYSKGDLEGAAAKFRESLRLDSEFFPAAFYLGACYAAGGRDREAAGAWQTSLITQSDAPFIYTLLSDAFMRLKAYDQAVDILVEASQLWPGQDDVEMRLGIAQASAGKASDAIITLDRYLTRHPTDHATLYVAMRTIYEARSTGKTLTTAAEDRQRFDKYAAAYAAAGGPQQADVERWKKTVDR